MDNTINIIVNEKVNPIFTKANSIILQKYGHVSESKLVELYHKELNATLCKKDLCYSSINFNNYQDMMMFTLRTS